MIFVIFSNEKHLDRHLAYLADLSKYCAGIDDASSMTKVNHQYIDFVLVALFEL